MTDLNVADICKELAPLLGGEFIPDINESGWGLRNWGVIDTGSGRIHVDLDPHKARLNISGSYPMTPRSAGAVAYGDKNPSISVSATKPIDKIAKDIKTRFIPEFSKIYAACVAAKAERDAYESKQNQLMTKFADLIGHGPIRNDQTEVSGFIDRDSDSNLYVRIRVSGGHVKLEIDSMTPARAEEVLALLKTK